MPGTFIFLIIIIQINFQNWSNVKWGHFLLETEKVQQHLNLLLWLSVVGRHMRGGDPQECVITVTCFLSSRWLRRPYCSLVFIQWISGCSNCLCVSGFVSSSAGSRESICSCFLFLGYEHWCSVAGVCPLVDNSDSAFLLQHSLPPHGWTGALPDHPAAAHHGLYR